MTQLTRRARTLSRNPALRLGPGRINDPMLTRPMLTATRPLWAAAALVALAPCVLAPRLSRAAPTGPRHLSPRHTHADTVTGDYAGPRRGGLSVLQLPGGRIQFDLQAYGPSTPLSGPNTGEASGVVALHQGVAVYQDRPDAENAGRGGGRLVMRFRGDRVVVRQEGGLEFGLGVTADGTYVRHSRRPPKFSKDGSAI